MFTKELEELVLKKNRGMEFVQSFIEDELKIPNIVLYYKNPISKDVILDGVISKSRIYGFLKKYETIIFNSESELINYVKNSQETWQNVCIIDYIGNFANRENVVKITYLNGEYVLCTSTELEAGFNLYHDVFALQETIDSGKAVWQKDHWGLDNIYEFFEKKGVIKEKNNPYTKIKRNNKFINSQINKG